MIAGVFTAKQWQIAEQWNNGWLIVAIIVILFIIFCLLLVSFYVPNPWKWRIFVPAILICMSLTVYSWLRTDNTANYQFNQWAAKITPQIRTKKAALFTYVSVPESEFKGYRALNDYPALTSLPMYTRHRVIASVVYLGRDDNARYFKLDGLVYRYSGPIQIGEQAALSGYRFRLKDRGYTQMGFINPSKNFTAALVIPRNQIEQHYHPSKEVVVTLEKMDGEWTTEKVYRK